MTSLCIEQEFTLGKPSKWEVARAAVFWGFVLAVIISPAVLGALILLQG